MLSELGGASGNRPVLHWSSRLRAANGSGLYSSEVEGHPDVDGRRCPALDATFCAGVRVVAWNLSGSYFENCTCNVVCPCTASLSLGADFDRCMVVLVFHIESGEVDGVDVSGLTVAAVGDTPKVMSDGNWRLGMIIDSAASDEQAEKLTAVFSGQLGGPMEGLVPLVGEMLGMERAEMRYESHDGMHRLTLGPYGAVEISEVVPFGVQTGRPGRLVDIFHPANTELTIAKAGDSHISVFGLEPALAGQSGFAATFAWSA